MDVMAPLFVLSAPRDVMGEGMWVGEMGDVGRADGEGEHILRDRCVFQE